MSEIVLVHFADHTVRLDARPEFAGFLDMINEAHRAGDMIRAGELLSIVKGQLGKRGRWLPWLRDNCEFNKAAADKCIRMARRAA
jgi:hypothetical protein